MVFIPDFTACENALTDERVRRARGRSRAGRPECESRATIGKGGLSVRTGPRWILLWTLAVGLLGVSAARGQVFGDSASNPSALRNKENQIWHVFGSVTTLDGQPAGNCAVRVQVASQSGELQALKVEGGDDPDARDKSLETNLQGEFRTDFTLDPNLYQNLKVQVFVRKPGYAPAHETVDFGSQGKTREIDIVIPEKGQAPDQLSLDELTATLGKRLRALGPASGSAKKDFEEGAGDLLDKNDSARALPRLAKAVKREPQCLACHLLYGLSLLNDGSWSSGEREFVAAAHLNYGAKAVDQRIEPLLVLGVIEEWRRQDMKAAGILMGAVKILPEDALALQEIGRTQIKLKNWESAEQYLAQAVKAGAPPEVRLLRIEALLGEGVLGEADQEMTAYLSGRDIRKLSPTARALYSDLHNRMELKSAGTVKSYVAEPAGELTKTVPELQGLEAESDQGNLPAVLNKVGEQVAQFFKSFPNTISQEHVQQERVRASGKTSESTPQKFNYLLLATASSNGVGLEEYRTDSAGTRTTAQGVEDGFMLTAGFASASLYFHPEYQSGALFRLLGRQTLDGQETWVVAFAQRPETARLLERFNTNDASVLILVQGVVWVDSSTYQIVRLRTDLLKPADKVRLERQTTEITYGEVRFKDSANPYWLPREVVVTVEWKGKTFRNLHEYSDFRLFNVESKEKRKPA